ncbi:unnamed protein product [Toxocara canis]|uniref:Lipid droplet-associated hydrolase n=1 Tax=Toxocara canis TaxID=6265 RepID=A0A183V190_TOXCA|nr:unnamed protein product [Toxocara canis]
MIFPVTIVGECISLRPSGNPGNEGFYEYFGRELLTNLEAETMKRYSASSEQYILYTVSHLNHVNLPRELRNNGAHNATDRFDLNDQVEHLADFCFEYLPKAGRIVMFGHSIGAYIMLRILPNLLKHEYNIVCACALFPTIERMAESPNGKRLFPILSRLDSFNALFVSLILCWLDLLPLSLRRWFCSWGLPTGNVPECVLDSAAELLCLNVFRNIIHMSTDELRKVCELDESLLKHSDRIRFYYGKTDKWCPIDFGYQMKDRLGEELVVIDDSDCEHAFVIKNSEIMARKLVNWVLP